MADRLAQLTQLAQAVPGLNQQAEKRAQAARQVQLQQQLGAAPTAPATRTAQAAAPGAAAAAGQIAGQAAAQEQQQLMQVGQQGLNAQATADRAQLGQAQTAQQEQLAGAETTQNMALSREELAARKQVSKADLASAERVAGLGLEQDNRLNVLSNKQANDLNRIGLDVKQKIFDSRLQFEKDENGRKFSNDRQLADYMAATARTDQEFQARAREVQQATERKIQLMQIAQAQVIRELEQAQKSSEGAKNFEHQKELQGIRDALAEKIRKEQAAAKNKAAMWQAAGTIVGAGAGAAIAGPGGYAAGAAAGATIGGGLATAFGGATA